MTTTPAKRALLPVTGGDLDRFGAIGAVFVLLGGFLVLGIRRKEEDF
ncbi:MAG: LPXTG cell wall anchor domain-containing protein [Actinomycetia bacterium]|nr:LPXTG cell wall anchor domain-containing protein [Actinomycetes bacterium]